MQAAETASQLACDSMRAEPAWGTLFCCSQSQAKIGHTSYRDLPATEGGGVGCGLTQLDFKWSAEIVFLDCASQKKEALNLEHVKGQSSKGRTASFLKARDRTVPLGPDCALGY